MCPDTPGERSDIRLYTRILRVHRSIRVYDRMSERLSGVSGHIAGVSGRISELNKFL